MDRKYCSHVTGDPVVTIVTWCARCSGWRFSRLGVLPGSRSATSSLEVLESHFLPAEDTSPDETWHLFMRQFNIARETVEDSLGVGRLPFD